MAERQAAGEQAAMAVGVGRQTVGAAPSRRLSRNQGLELHLGIFAIVSWNLAAINFAYMPERLWFWPVVVAWAAILVGHAGFVLCGRIRANRHTASWS
jgi:hypothetical protein